jgi:hypothetical protein
MHDLSTGKKWESHYNKHYKGFMKQFKNTQEKKDPPKKITETSVFEDFFKFKAEQIR